MSRSGGGRRVLGIACQTPLSGTLLDAGRPLHPFEILLG